MVVLPARIAADRLVQRMCHDSPRRDRCGIAQLTRDHRLIDLPARGAGVGRPDHSGCRSRVRRRKLRAPTTSARRGGVKRL
jgi:hypothetical protein